MNKILVAASAAIFASGAALAQGPHSGYPELVAAHDHVDAALQELKKGRAANHFDGAGHAAKAEEYLLNAAAELKHAEEVDRHH